MVRIFSALAAMVATAAPLYAMGVPVIGNAARAPAPHVQAIGLDTPVDLGSMAVTATPLP